ncbi:hypothetical protein SS50377_20454 [Spironucleus salmonicida]|uniref:Uncharacterized protein n=1 Tax=Spironucleus salmonicida TaxID=348837 RepID=V6LXR2_9EUKA|nr:hypothetical protein SS50377_20454 [Spironucleus salmonicida]|eukprot:EST45604.1 Hypothetical protein SS50377_14456 [Spironucleus salmonicida]
MSEISFARATSELKFETSGSDLPAEFKTIAKVKIAKPQPVSYLSLIRSSRTVIQVFYGQVKVVKATFFRQKFFIFDIKFSLNSLTAVLTISKRRKDCDEIAEQLNLFKPKLLLGEQKSANSIQQWLGNMLNNQELRENIRFVQWLSN